MKILHNVLGWINNEEAEVGEEYLVAHGGELVDGVLTGHGSHTATYEIIDPDIAKAETERNWQESELLRTDNWPKDRPPGGQAILDYRVALRDYNNQDIFPNGTRPEE